MRRQSLPTTKAPRWVDEAEVQGGGALGGGHRQRRGEEASSAVDEAGIWPPRGGLSLAVHLGTAGGRNLFFYYWDGGLGSIGMALVEKSPWGIRGLRVVLLLFRRTVRGHLAVLHLCQENTNLICREFAPMVLLSSREENLFYARTRTQEGDWKVGAPQEYREVLHRDIARIGTDQYLLFLSETLVGHVWPSSQPGLAFRLAIHQSS